MLMQYKLCIFTFLAISVFSHSVEADIPPKSTCTAQEISNANSRLITNIMTPIPKAELIEAFQLIQLCAEGNHPIAQYSLAYAYESGNGVKKDISRARELYLKSAYAGVTPAMAMLVDYYNGAFGKVVDLPECYAWAEVAGRLGDSQVAGRASLCNGTEGQRIEGKKRADVILEKIKINMKTSRPY